MSTLLFNPERAVAAAIEAAAHAPLFAEIETCAGAREVQIVARYKGHEHLRAMRLDNSTHIHIHPKSIRSLRIGNQPFAA